MDAAGQEFGITIGGVDDVVKEDLLLCTVTFSLQTPAQEVGEAPIFSVPFHILINQAPTSPRRSPRRLR